MFNDMTGIQAVIVRLHLFLMELLIQVIQLNGVYIYVYLFISAADNSLSKHNLPHFSCIK